MKQTVSGVRVSFKNPDSRGRLLFHTPALHDHIHSLFFSTTSQTVTLVKQGQQHTTTTPSGYKLYKIESESEISLEIDG